MDLIAGFFHYATASQAALNEGILASSCATHMNRSSSKGCACARIREGGVRGKKREEVIKNAVFFASLRCCIVCALHEGYERVCVRVCPFGVGCGQIDRGCTSTMRWFLALACRLMRVQVFNAFSLVAICLHTAATGNIMPKGRMQRTGMNGL